MKEPPRDKQSKRSMCSSEFESRIEAFGIQLEEERKRRLEVEKQIQEFILERGGPQAAVISRIITEGDVAKLGSSGKGAAAPPTGSVRSNAAHASQRSLQPSPRERLPPIDAAVSAAPRSKEVRFPPTPPLRKHAAAAARPPSSDVVERVEQNAAACETLLRQLNHSHATVLSRKPPLPTAARGITRAPGAAGCDYVMARRSKATPAQLYMMNLWHQERVDRINAFTFGIAGSS